MKTTFPQDALVLKADGPTAEFVNATATQFRDAISLATLLCLGVHNLAAVPGVNHCGGLMFTASIIPMNSDGHRADAPTSMAVMISLTALDEIDIEVREYGSERVHANVERIFIDQVDEFIAALDHDGDDVLNPRLWSNN